MIREIAGYTIEAKVDKVHVDFTIYDGLYLESVEEQDRLGMDHDLDAVVNSSRPNTLKDVPILAYIKWDGCSNWNIPGDHYQLHFCGLKPARDFGLMITGLYEWAAELLPEHKEEILSEF